MRKRPISGVYRPQAYLGGPRSYCSNCKFDVFKQPIERGDQVVAKIIIESPVGFGDKLQVGKLLTIRNGLDIDGKGVILEVLGYLDELPPPLPKNKRL